MKNPLFGSRRAVTVLALLAASEPASAADPATTVGFVFGSVAMIRPACGLSDDPGGLGRLLVSAGLTKADISPRGSKRAAFEASAYEARLLLTAKLEREGRETFCAFARQRYGPAGLRVMRG